MQLNFNKFCLYLKLALFFTILASNLACGEKMKVLEKQPVFNLRISAFGLKYFVSVNGFSVFEEFDSQGQITTSVPLNQWFHPKYNSFSLDVLPDSPGEAINPNAYVKLDLIITDDSDKDIHYSIPVLYFLADGLKSDTEIDSSMNSGNFSLDRNSEIITGGNIELTVVNSEKVKQYEGAAVYKRGLTIPNSLPLWGFFESDRLPDYYTMNDEDYNTSRDSLFLEYQKIQNALISKKIDEILTLFEERNRETDQAFYYPKGTTANRLKESLLGNANNPDLRIAELKEDYLSISLLDEKERRLVKLTRNGRAPAIAFQIKTGGSISHPIIYRKKNGKWIISR